MAYFTAPNGSIKRVSGSSVAKASSPESTNSPNSSKGSSGSMCNGTIIFIGSGLLLLAIVVGVLMYRKRNQI